MGGQPHSLGFYLTAVSDKAYQLRQIEFLPVFTIDPLPCAAYKMMHRNEEGETLMNDRKHYLSDTPKLLAVSILFSISGAR